MSKKVFIGVGHGGSDPGAVSNGIRESQANLDVAKACVEVLKRHGVDTMISRTSDVTEDLSIRIKECNAFKPDLAADIHHNAGGGDGAEVYHARNDKSDDTLAKNILDEIVKIGQNSRGLKTKTTSSGADYFGFIRQVKCPSVLIECAFLDNKNDVKIVDTLAERKKMGEAIAKGFLKTLGIQYKAESTNTATTTPKPTQATTSTADKIAKFLPPRGYFKYGDSGENIYTINEFYYKVFPGYAKTLNRNAMNVRGKLFGENTRAWTKEFQRRTGLEPDGYIGKLTLAEMIKYGLKI